MQHVFPEPVILPKDRVIENGRLQIALGKASKALLYTWRTRKGFPVFHKSGRNTFYLCSEIVAWLDKQGIDYVRK